MDAFDKVQRLLMLHQNHVGNTAVDPFPALGKTVRSGGHLHALIRRDDQLPVTLQRFPIRGDQYGFQRHEDAPL